MSDEGPKEYERGEAVLSIFKRGAEFTRELISENEMLRRRLHDIQSRQEQAVSSPGEWEKLRVELLSRIDELENENHTLLQQILSVENENKHFADRYLEIEEENNNLANLYVASFQLHSTLDPSEVLKVILEIVINLIGAEVFCVYLYDEKDGVLEPVAAEGRETSTFPRLTMGSGFVGQSVETGDVASRNPSEVDDTDEPLVSIPLRVHDRPVGAIVIHSLLQQKDGFSPLDQELFTLMAGHAATAVFASRLYSQSERKLNTIQGFIELLTR